MMIDVLIAAVSSALLTALATIFIISATRINHDNEIYMEGFNNGYKKGYNKGLEKQIPKKPIYSEFADNGFDETVPYKAECPACGYEFEFGTWNDDENHHCICGQRMSWGEEE